MKGCVQWNTVYGVTNSVACEFEHSSSSIISQRLTDFVNKAPRTAKSEVFGNYALIFLFCYIRGRVAFSLISFI